MIGAFRNNIEIIRKLHNIKTWLRRYGHSCIYDSYNTLRTYIYTHKMKMGIHILNMYLVGLDPDLT